MKRTVSLYRLTGCGSDDKICQKSDQNSSFRTVRATAVPRTKKGTASAEEGGDAFLGKPFPDFTVTDTDGNTFTLSEVLKDHKAVLINFWTTWCEPCANEFPLLNEAYKEYGDRVAFIALSNEQKDTIEKIAEYRKETGLPSPWGVMKI